MISGKSLFNALLDRIGEERSENSGDDPPSARIRGLSTGFVVAALEGVSLPLHRIDNAYLDHGNETGQPTARTSEILANTNTELDAASDPPAEPAVPEPQPHLLRLLPDEIAADLGLTPLDTIAVLHDKRRTFARVNHPDRVHEAHRHLANERMTVANQLIDRAIARLSAGSRAGFA